MKNVEPNFILKIGTLLNMAYNLSNLLNVSFLMEIPIELFAKQRIAKNLLMEIIF